jgi:hypothetical protein
MNSSALEKPSRTGPQGFGTGTSFPPSMPVKIGCCTLYPPYVWSSSPPPWSAPMSPVVDDPTPTVTRESSTPPGRPVRSRTTCPSGVYRHAVDSHPHGANLKTAVAPPSRILRTFGFRQSERAVRGKTSVRWMSCAGWVRRAGTHAARVASCCWTSQCAPGSARGSSRSSSVALRHRSAWWRLWRRMRPSAGCLTGSPGAVPSGSDR